MFKDIRFFILHCKRFSCKNYTKKPPKPLKIGFFLWKQTYFWKIKVFFVQEKLSKNGDFLLCPLWVSSSPMYTYKTQCFSWMELLIQLNIKYWLFSAPLPFLYPISLIYLASQLGNSFRLHEILLVTRIHQYEECVSPFIRSRGGYL